MNLMYKAHHDLVCNNPIYYLSDRPYEGMNITGVKGLSAAEIATLKALGAVEESVKEEG